MPRIRFGGWGVRVLAGFLLLAAGLGVPALATVGAALFAALGWR